MSEHASPPSEPKELDIFDAVLDGHLACRVCGVFVPSAEYARVHWDWHEASNGA